VNARLLSAARAALLELAAERDQLTADLGVMPLTHASGAPRTTINGVHHPITGNTVGSGRDEAPLPFPAAHAFACETDQ